MKAKNCPCLSVKLFADIATQSIHLRLSRRRGKMNIRYQVELSEAERSELESLLRGGQHAAASSSELRSCSRATPGCRTRPLPRASVWAARGSRLRASVLHCRGEQGPLARGRCS